MKRALFRWGALGTVAAAAALAFPAAAVPAGAQAAAAPARAAAEPAAAALILDKINTVGILDYPGSYVNVKLAAAHTIALYEARPSAGLARAVSRIRGTGAYRLTIRHAPRSFATLEALTKRMAHDKSLARSGIRMTWWGPDQARDMVTVTMNRPVGARPTALAPALVGSLDRQFAARYGPGLVTVSAAAQPYPVAQNARDSDDNPFLAGDGWSDNFGAGFCTSGFTMKNTSTGKYYILTAGHCGKAGDNANPFYKIATLYYTTDWDLATLTPGGTGTASGAVWYGPDNIELSYRVIGQLIPLAGSKATEDGDGLTTGQRTGNTVGKPDICFTETDEKGKNPHKVCDAGYDTHSGSNICVAGDSGGPVYVPESGGVYAIGIHVAGPDRNVHGYCYYQEIVRAGPHTGLSLVTETS
jgi:hypothetical protein